MKTTLLVIIALTQCLAVSLFAQECINVAKDNSHHKCRLEVREDGRYVIKATATATDGYKGPKLALTITVDDKNCADEKLEFVDNNGTIGAVGIVELKAGNIYTVEATQTNSHATATGVSVEVVRERPIIIHQR